MSFFGFCGAGHMYNDKIWWQYANHPPIECWQIPHNMFEEFEKHHLWPATGPERAFEALCSRWPCANCCGLAPVAATVKKMQLKECLVPSKYVCHMSLSETAVGDKFMVSHHFQLYPHYMRFFIVRTPGRSMSSEKTEPHGSSLDTVAPFSRKKPKKLCPPRRQSPGMMGMGVRLSRLPWWTQAVETTVLVVRKREGQYAIVLIPKSKVLVYNKHNRTIGL